MFESARVKLTLFYLAILLGFSLLLTLGFRAFVQAEFNHANDVQRGAVHQIGQQYFVTQTQPDDTPSPFQPDQNFARIQREQARETQSKLTREAIFLNIGVLVIGTGVSYWYAGRALRPIQQAHERQKRFTSDASHELRTPLASMQLENEIFLRQKSFSDREVRDQIGSNLEEVERLERLTTSLLDLNRYELGGLKKQKVPAHAAVAEAIAHTAHAAHAKSVTFKNKAAKSSVLANRESLVQLLSILLDNAAKYGPSNGTVEVTGELHGNDYQFSVRDHGAGIADKDLPYIFERMYRGDKARNNTVSGHGIGLSLAQQIAVANGTHVSAANHVEGGAVFSFSLPKA